MFRALSVRRSAVGLPRLCRSVGNSRRRLPNRARRLGGDGSHRDCRCTPPLRLPIERTDVLRFYGCRSGREVAAWLARVAAQPSTDYRKGVRDVLLWALSAGPCPVEPTAAAFSERRAQQLAAQQPACSTAGPEAARLLGAADGARWLISLDVPAPSDSYSTSPDPHFSTPDAIEQPDVHT